MHDAPSNFHLARTMFTARDLPFDVTADATHAVGVAIESHATPCTPLVFLARPAGSRRHALADRLVNGPLAELEDIGQEFVAYHATAELTWRGRVAFRVLCLKHAAVRTIVRVLTAKGASLSWT